MESLENLAFFVRACPIILETSDKVKNPVFNLGRNYVYVADFDNGEPDINIARKALWYLSRTKYSDFGINDYAVTIEGKSRLGTFVPTREMPCPFRYYYKKGFMSPLRVAPVNPVYLRPFEYLFFWKGKIHRGTYFVDYEYDPFLRNLFSKWLEGEVPYAFAEIFSDPIENHKRLYRMIGSQTYKIAKNKNISPEIKEVVELISRERRKEREKGIPVEDLEPAVRLMARGLDEGEYDPYWDDRSGSWINHASGFSKEEIEKAIKVIAQAAYDIRQGYARKGQEVRHGLVHAQSYRKLERIASEKADPEIVSKIIQRHKEGYDMKAENYYVFGDFREAMALSGVFRFPEPVSDDDCERIGRLRVPELLTGKIPYAREMKVIGEIMRNYLSRKRFHDEVNNWLRRHLGRTVNWLEIKRELSKKVEP